MAKKLKKKASIRQILLVIVAITIGPGVYGKELAATDLVVKEPVAPFKIPVSSAWGMGVGGTKDAEALDPVREDRGTKLRPALIEATVLLSDKIRNPRKRRPAEPAFIVEGVGREALLNMLVAFKGKNAPLRVASKDQEISLVFFTKPVSNSIVLDKIEVVGHRYILTYHFVINDRMAMSPHFVLIPLGKLEPGDYKVVIKEGPPVIPARRAVPQPSLRSFVCSDSNFYIRDVK
jgi:hypothetical protein